MNWKLFVARRIYRSKEGGKEISKPAVRIATVGIAIGLAVMIVAVAVVIGSEGQGVRPEILEQAKQHLIIPMDENCESLNAAIAAAIVMWQMKQ